MDVYITKKIMTISRAGSHLSIDSYGAFYIALMYVQILTIKFHKKCKKSTSK